MEIKNEFIVRAPARQTWDALVDVPRVAMCLPGAKLTDVDGEVYAGTVKIKVGPITTEYAGKAGFVERDDSSMRACIEAKGAETRGAGSASAFITTSLTERGDHTVVVVETDLSITGKVAQFGRGMIAEIAGGLLAQFSANLEQMLVVHSQTGIEPEAVERSDAAPVGTPAVAALDAATLISGPLIKRIAPVLVVSVVVGYIWLRRRRRNG